MSVGQQPFLLLPRRVNLGCFSSASGRGCGVLFVLNVCILQGVGLNVGAL